MTGNSNINATTAYIINHDHTELYKLEGGDGEGWVCM